MAFVGQHFLDRNKEWGLAQGNTVALVDLEYAHNPSPGFDAQSAIERLAQDCDQLWQAGVFAQPYLRVDYSPTLTLAGGDNDYNRNVEHVMRWWNGAPRANLTIICGNEPNLGQVVQPAECTQVVQDIVTLRNVLGYPTRIFAPAIAPWSSSNPTSPEDMWGTHPRGLSTEWENFQWGMARRLGYTPDGYALHAYGRPLHIFDKDEAHRLTPFDPRGASNGFLWYKDAVKATEYGANAANLVFAVTEYNTFTDRHTSESYPYGHFTEARLELEKDPRIESLCIFVGEPHGEEWAQESTKLRIGQCAALDDDLNQELQR